MVMNKMYEGGRGWKIWARRQERKKIRKSHATVPLIDKFFHRNICNTINFKGKHWKNYAQYDNTKQSLNMTGHNTYRTVQLSWQVIIIFNFQLLLWPVFTMYNLYKHCTFTCFTYIHQNSIIWNCIYEW